MRIFEWVCIFWVCRNLYYFAYTNAQYVIIQHSRAGIPEQAKLDSPAEFNDVQGDVLPGGC